MEKFIPLFLVYLILALEFSLEIYVLGNHSLCT